MILKDDFRPFPAMNIPAKRVRAPSPSRGGLGRGWGYEALKGDPSLCPIPLPTSPLKGEEFLWQQCPLIEILEYPLVEHKIRRLFLERPLSPRSTPLEAGS